jgi:hypothetical protein
MLAGMFAVMYMEFTKLSKGFGKIIDINEAT